MAHPASGACGRLSRTRPAHPYQLVWCHDVEAAVAFLSALMPQAEMELHASHKYAEVRHDGKVVAVASTEMGGTQRQEERAGLQQVQLEASRQTTLMERARAVGARITDDHIEGPDRLQAVWS